MQVSEAIHRDPKRIRLAITRTEGDPAYPAEGDDPTVYPIIFLDAEFTETAGAQTLDTTERSAEPAHYAFALDVGYVAEDTNVLVVNVGGQWYILGASSDALRAMEIVFTAKADFASTDATVEGTVVEWDEAQNGSDTPDDPDPTNAGLTIENGAGNLAFSGVDGATGFARWKPGSGAYRIYQMECPAY